MHLVVYDPIRPPQVAFAVATPRADASRYRARSSQRMKRFTNVVATSQWHRSGIEKPNHNNDSGVDRERLIGATLLKCLASASRFGLARAKRGTTRFGPKCILVMAQGFLQKHKVGNGNSARDTQSLFFFTLE